MLPADNPEISVIIPVANEAATLAALPGANQWRA